METNLTPMERKELRDAINLPIMQKFFSIWKLKNEEALLGLRLIDLSTQSGIVQASHNQGALKNYEELMQLIEDLTKKEEDPDGAQ